MKKGQFGEHKIVRILKELKEENRHLIRMYAELCLGPEVFKDLLDIR